MLQKIKGYVFPTVDKEIQDYIDRESLNSLRMLSMAIMLFELFTLFLFVVTRKGFDQEVWISIGSAFFCVITCLVVYFCTKWMRGKPQIIHRDVTAFKFFFAVVLSAWAIWVSWRHYNQDDQLLTFFTVQLMIVCFIPLIPWISAIITIVIYSGLYVVLYSVDGAATVNKFNFFMLVLVAIAGMTVRFHSQVRLSEKSILLQKKNEELEYVSHHDGLTGLRNRMALNRDLSLIRGDHLSVFMIDIDYFKEFNDSHGHSAGDEVLVEVARQLRRLYPESYCYRYGGDEFLVISPKDDIYRGDTFQFEISAVPDKDIFLSIGSIEGAAQDQFQLVKLIGDADQALYEVKRRTHSPEYGGHERRHNR